MPRQQLLKPEADSALEVEWCQGRDLDRTCSDVCPHTESSVPLTHFFRLQVEVLTSLKALGHRVDPSQLPAALGGPFPYSHSEWVQFFQVSTATAFSPAFFLPSLSCPVDPSTLSGSN